MVAAVSAGAAIILTLSAVGRVEILERDADVEVGRVAVWQVLGSFTAGPSARWSVWRWSRRWIIARTRVVWISKGTTITGGARTRTRVQVTEGASAGRVQGLGEDHGLSARAASGFRVESDSIKVSRVSRTVVSKRAVLPGGVVGVARGAVGVAGRSRRVAGCVLVATVCSGAAASREVVCR